MHKKGLPALARCFGLWYAPVLEWLPQLQGRYVSTATVERGALPRRSTPFYTPRQHGQSALLNGSMDPVGAWPQCPGSQLALHTLTHPYTPLHPLHPVHPEHTVHTVHTVPHTPRTPLRYGVLYELMVSAHTLTLVHGDCHLDNIFFSERYPNGCALIDFALVAFGPAVRALRFEAS